MGIRNGCPLGFPPNACDPSTFHRKQGSREALGPETVPVQASGLPWGLAHWYRESLGIHGNPSILKTSHHLGGGNSKIFYFHPETWGNDPSWRAYFSNGLKPPTRPFFVWEKMDWKSGVEKHPPEDLRFVPYDQRVLSWRFVFLSFFSNQQPGHCHGLPMKHMKVPCVYISSKHLPWLMVGI